jgi:conjugative transfer region protein TrbK
MNAPWKAVGRPWLMVLLGLALAALALARLHPLAPSPGRRAEPPSEDQRLARCRAAGERAADDPACQVAWRDARSHFLGLRS